MRILTEEEIVEKINSEINLLNEAIECEESSSAKTANYQEYLKRLEELKKLQKEFEVLDSFTEFQLTHFTMELELISQPIY